MRLTPSQRQKLKEAARYHFGQNAEIWLFGSRVDDRRRGGDYDFYIETAYDNPDRIVSARLALLAELQGGAEFQGEKIDLVIASRVPESHLPIHDSAKNRGVRL
uniref:Nucleotidyltransferase domain-containing protein n=1 Tax=Candidatus Kentrum sp. FM TaxID=2126340 RepID=A0A450SS26_9GAMM|nr:MAG: hypothetical protein BECKFM1743A_GA0114220_101772 [Candidatus Kentron sp. FM]VFJ58782.1 MAG: hypothetical protein BECKFM1743C_GA0114222_102338 [Candidatus Kentron sp. FM]VFK21069.1 MAG: hypothetical protein BECKFM1743B_GA0114221_107542 [Candidatus Kentron sp. FM]